ncbi:aldo/keto reductase, partial [Streptomyces sp. MBT57]|nr:aldo/keto reductase [Streptomyces sp. MBT57]
AAPALAEAHEAGLTVIVKEGMANGRLLPRQAPAVFREIAADAGVGGDAVALALVLHQPWAGVVLSGAATVTQLAGNLHAPVVGLDEEQRDRLDALVEEPESYWRHRAALPWH